MNKKRFSILALSGLRALLLALVCGTVLAGSGVAQPLAKGVRAGKALTARGITSAQVSRILNERVRRTMAEASFHISAQPGLLMDEEYPIESIFKWPSKRMKFTLYPEVPFWDKLSDEDKRNYFMAANNRAIRRVLQERAAGLEQLKQLLPRLWQEKIAFAAKPPEELLVEAIPPEAKYILLGEEHCKTAVQQFIARFLLKYREAYPNRKIILLTEFLPAGSKGKTALLQDIQHDSFNYGLVFSTALGNGISIHGLEARSVFYGQGDVEISLSDQSKDYFDLWIVPESIRLRNRFWLEQIKAFRQKNPDAVLLIYAGAEHLSYYAPFSVGAKLPAEETFSAHVFNYSDIIDKERDFLDWLGDEKYPFYKVKTLSWKDKALRRAAGFDIRFSVSKKDIPSLKNK